MELAAEAGSHGITDLPAALAAVDAERQQEAAPAVQSREVRNADLARDPAANCIQPLLLISHCAQLMNAVPPPTVVHTR